MNSEAENHCLFDHVGLVCRVQVLAIAIKLGVKADRDVEEQSVEVSVMDNGTVHTNRAEYATAEKDNTADWNEVEEAE